LIQINAPGAGLRNIQTSNMEDGMTVQDIEVVTFVVCVFLVFGITLGFASWDETRRMRKLRTVLPQEMKTPQREKVRN
jgi:hypothetical protein